ncbi:UNVERIFIED_CONTAM: hypothetical protein PYX00_001424 [Menopon gallinae]|uniref:Ferritin n=1 Tax=Menopon gallinae TaxID=328185 RepID=A0AAW2ID65_9NEOP
MMIIALLFASVLGTSSAVGGFCESDVTAACKHGGSSDLLHCDSRFGEIDGVEFDLQTFVNKHIAHSFQYLLLSSHFKTYEKNRGGFSKLFRHLSDETWKNAIDLIKYLTKRGGRADFGGVRQDDLLVQIAVNNMGTYELNELESLAKALDIQKSFAEEANRIHLVAVKDSEAMSHLENTFVHRLADSIRALAGHANDLKNMIAANTYNSLHVYLFDEYLKKLY